MVQYLVERAHCDVSEYHDSHCVILVKTLSQESVMISDHTHSCPDVTVDNCLCIVHCRCTR